tara:strand:+ start:5039 stop:5461 length:423 start_codon:yes stop_codon:yes gene_type:complete
MKFKVLIVAGNYYKKITDTLIFSSKKKLKNNLNIKYKSKVMKFQTKVIEVPGSFEIPVIISKNIKKYDAFVALGCIIKGQTPHFDFISQSINNALMDLSINSKKPVGNGIITCLNKKQATKRSSKKGYEAANAVISVLSK